MQTCWPFSFEAGEEIQDGTSIFWPHLISEHITLSEHGLNTQGLKTVFTLSVAARVHRAAAQVLTDLVQTELPASLTCEHGLGPSATPGHC